MSDFDPYRKWLGIPPQEQPPNYYRLLGLAVFESDAEVIGNAADRQMAHLRTFQSGKNSALSQKILNEVAAARICLLDPQKRAQYDVRLREQLGVASAPASERKPDAPPADAPAAFEPPSIIRFPGSRRRTAARTYHVSHRRRKNRWKSPAITLICCVLGVALAVILYFLSVENHWFEPPAKPMPAKKQSEKQSKAPEKAASEKAKEASPATEKTVLEDLPKPLPSGEAKTPEQMATENDRSGKSLCFMKGKWEEGLPKLAESGNEELKKLAQKELSAPEGAAERLALADGWWDLSEKYFSPAREQIRRHAVEWYRKVVGDLADSQRDRVEYRMSLESEPGPGEKKPIDPNQLD
jgi:hypothetical protein